MFSVEPLVNSIFMLFLKKIDFEFVAKKNILNNFFNIYYLDLELTDNVLTN